MSYLYNNNNTNVNMNKYRITSSNNKHFLPVVNKSNPVATLEINNSANNPNHSLFSSILEEKTHKYVNNHTNKSTSSSPNKRVRAGTANTHLLPISPSKNVTPATSTSSTATNTPIRRDSCDIHETIYISGMSGRFPSSDSVLELWENLLNGVDMMGSSSVRYPIDKHPLYSEYNLPTRIGTIRDIESFDAQFFQINPTMAKQSDPAHRLLLTICYEAIIDAGINLDEIRGKNGCVIVGASCIDTYASRTIEFNSLQSSDAVGANLSVTASRIAYFFGLNGLSVQVDTACSSSLTALSIACEQLNSGKSDFAIVASAHLLIRPHFGSMMQKLGMVANDGKVKHFDASADGLARSESVNAVVLTKANSSLCRYAYAKVVGTGANTDGYKPEGLTTPSAQSQANLINTICNRYNLNPLNIRWFQMHGTGTTVGDPIEAKAIDSVLREAWNKVNANKKHDNEYSVWVSSIKTNMGHAEPASGLNSIIAVCQAIQNNIIPANLHFHTPNPKITPLIEGRLKLVTSNIKCDFSNNNALVAINSFGFGGTNAHCILQACNYSQPNNNTNILHINSDEYHLALLCSRTSSGLNLLVEEFQNKVSHNPQYVQAYSELVTTTSTAKLTQHLLQHKAAIITHIPSNNSNKPEFIVHNPAVADASNNVSERNRLVFLFSGMGSQCIGMASQLFQFSVFSNTFQSCLSSLNNILMHLRSQERQSKYNTIWENNIQQDGFDLNKFPLLFVSPTEDLLENNILFSSLSIIIYEICLIELLKSSNINPDYVLGHSLGELTAAYAANRLTLQQTVAVAWARAKSYQFIQSNFNNTNNNHNEDVNGRMIVTSLNWNVRQNNSNIQVPSNIYFSCHNSPTSVTISGSASAIQEIKAELINHNIFARDVKSCGFAFHSPLIYAAAKPYQYALEKIFEYTNSNNDNLNSNNKVVWYSTSDNKNNNIVNDTVDLIDYLIGNMTNPVLFCESLTALNTASNTKKERLIYVEISPNVLFKSILAQNVGKSARLHYIGAQNKEKNNLYETVANIHCAGYLVKLPVIEHNNSMSSNNGPLPPHNFQHLVSWKFQKYPIMDMEYERLAILQQAKNFIEAENKKAMGVSNQLPKLQRKPSRLLERTMQDKFTNLSVDPLKNKLPPPLEINNATSRENNSDTISININNGNTIEFTVDCFGDPSYQYLLGHIVDGMLLIPASFYIYLAWRGFAMVKKTELIQSNVELNNIVFHSPTLIHPKSKLKFIATIDVYTGHFSVSEQNDNQLKCSGTIKNTNESNQSNTSTESNINNPNNNIILNRSDIYEELNVRGYQYTGLFKSLSEIQFNKNKQGKDFSMCRGTYSIPNNITLALNFDTFWVSFIDSLLQATFIYNKYRNLYIPTAINKLKLLGTRVYNKLNTTTNNINNNVIQFPAGFQVPFCIYPSFNNIIAGDIAEIRLMQFSQSRPSTLSNSLMQFSVPRVTNNTANNTVGFHKLNHSVFIEKYVPFRLDNGEKSHTLLYQPVNEQFYDYSTLSKKYIISMLLQVFGEDYLYKKSTAQLQQIIETNNNQALNVHNLFQKYWKSIEPLNTNDINKLILPIIHNPQHEYYASFKFIHDFYSGIITKYNNYKDRLNDLCITGRELLLTTSTLGAVYYSDPLLNDCQTCYLEEYINYITDIHCDLINMKPIQMLEIGCGTGGSTIKALSLLNKRGYPFHYTLTDISRGFFPELKNKIANKIENNSNSGDINSKYSYKVWNISENPEKNDIALDYYDCIVADNVVHVGNNIEETLNNLNKVLKIGGVLLLKEITHAHPLMMGIFGWLKETWPSEANKRDYGCLLSISTWYKVLNASGFSIIRYDSDNELVSMILAVKGSTSPAHLLTDNIANKATIESKASNYIWLNNDKSESIIAATKELAKCVYSGDNPNNYVYFISSNTRSKGLIGLVNCIRREKESPFHKSGCIIFNENWLQQNFNNLPLNDNTINTINGTSLPHEYIAYLDKLVLTFPCQRHLIQNEQGQFYGMVHCDISKQMSNKHLLIDESNKTSIDTPIRYTYDSARSCMNAIKLPVFDYLSNSNRNSVVKVSSYSVLNNEGSFASFAGIITNDNNHKVCGITMNPLQTHLNVAITSDIIPDFMFDIPKDWTEQMAISTICPLYLALYLFKYKYSLSENNKVFLEFRNNQEFQIQCYVLIHIIKLNPDSIFTFIANKEDISSFPIPTNNVITSTSQLFQHQFNYACLCHYNSDTSIESYINLDEDGVKIYLDYSKFNVDCPKIAPRSSSAAINVHQLVCNIALSAQANSHRTKALNEMKSLLQTNNIQIPSSASNQQSDNKSSVLFPINPDSCISMTECAKVANVIHSPSVLFGSLGTYLIVGGFGGFGCELIDWMADHGAKYFIITSRNGLTSPKQWYRYYKWVNRGLKITISTVNLNTSIGCEKLLNTEYPTDYPPLQGIFQLALQLVDNPILNMSCTNFDLARQSKEYATKYLDEYTRKYSLNLQYFVLFSSTGCGFGSGTQSNYGYANSAAENIINKRVSDGLSGLAIQWGSIADVGFVANLNTKLTVRRESVASTFYSPNRNSISTPDPINGSPKSPLFFDHNSLHIFDPSILTPIPIKHCLQLLGQLLNTPQHLIGSPIIAIYARPHANNNIKSISTPPTKVLEKSTLVNEAQTPISTVTPVLSSRELTERDNTDSLTECCTLLGFENISTVPLNQTLGECGLDSMIAIKFRSILGNYCSNFPDNKSLMQCTWKDLLNIITTKSSTRNNSISSPNTSTRDDTPQKINKNQFNYQAIVPIHESNLMPPSFSRKDNLKSSSIIINNDNSNVSLVWDELLNLMGFDNKSVPLNLRLGDTGFDSMISIQFKNILKNHNINTNKISNLNLLTWNELHDIVHN